MIKANELRIGNLINDSSCVTQITDEMVQLFDETGYEWDLFSNLIPIPLTEEWLLRFGFEKEYDASWILNDFNFFSVCSGDKMPRHLNFQDVGIWASYQHNDENTFYVHEFQNLYFALTGEELELKNG